MEDLRVSSKEKCPLCGGDVILGECSSCGYAPPDTEEISAVYDLDPGNVVFGEAAFEDDEDDIPSIEVPDASTLPTLEQRRQAAKLKKAREKAAAEAAKKSPQPLNNAAFTPYVKPNYGNTPKPADTSGMPTRFVKAVSDFVFYHWWKFLLVAAVPTLGYGLALFYFVINSDAERKKSEIFLAAAMLALTLLLQFAGWDPTGLDTILQHILMWLLKDDYTY